MTQKKNSPALEPQEMIRLVKEAQAGQSSAIEALYQAYYQDVFGFARTTVKNDDIACDITQDSFLDMIEHIHSLKEPAAFVKWMRQITYHRCTRYFKKNREVLLDEEEDGDSAFDRIEDTDLNSIPSEVLEQKEFRNIVQSMLDDLSEAQRSALMLQFYDDFSVAQIAQIQGVSEGTVKSRLNYGRKALKTAVENYEKKNGIKLHSVGALPLFMLYFSKMAMPADAAASVGAAVSKAAASMAVGVGAKAVSIPLVGKIVAGVLAAAVTVGGVALLSSPDAPAEPTEPADPQPGCYASEDMQIYRQSHLLGDRFDYVLGEFPEYIVTTDRQIYSLEDVTTPLQPQEDAQSYFTAGGLGWFDSTGNAHLQHEQQLYTYPQLKGTPIGSMKTIREDPPCLITQDETGFYVTKAGGGSSLPLDVGSRLTLLDSNYVAYYTSEQITAYHAVQSAFGLNLLGDLIWSTADSYMIGTGYSLEVGDDRGLVTMMGAIPKEGKLLTWNSSTVLAVNPEGQLLWGSTQVPFPEGYNADMLQQTLLGDRVIMLFSDGNVYTWDRPGMFTQAEPPIKLETLSTLGQQGHIRQLRLSSYTPGGQLIVLMDDNTLYHAVYPK